MKKISIENLPEGKYISSPVYLDDKYILLSPDIEVTSELKRLLKKWEFKEVYSDGTPTNTPGSGTSSKETNVEFSLMDKSLLEQEEELAARQFIEKIADKIDAYFRKFLEHNDLPITPLSDIVKEITSEIHKRRSFLLSVNIENMDGDRSLVVHSVKTAVLALSLGDFMKLPPHKLIELGIASLLHELGMMLLPSKIYKNNRKLSEKERQIIKTHPVITYKTLKEAEFPSPIYLAVLEHHECVNGTGYPRGITGEKISLYGKIIAVASAYSAATSKREFRESKDGHSGIMDLLSGKGTKYDGTILRAMVYILSIYPIGTYVLLNNGVRGVVIKTDLENPKFPVLKLLVDEKGVPYNRKPIFQGSEDDEIQISRALTRKEITELKELFK